MVLKVYKCTRLNTLFFLNLNSLLVLRPDKKQTDKWIKTFRQMVLPVMLVKVTRSVVLVMEIINGSTTHKSLIRGADCDWGACQHKVGTIYTEVMWRPLHRGHTMTSTQRSNHNLYRRILPVSCPISAAMAYQQIKINNSVIL